MMDEVTKIERVIVDSNSEILKSMRIKPNGLALLEDFTEMLASVPREHLDEIDNLGHIIHLVVKRTAPDMSNALKISLPDLLHNCCARE